MRWKIIVQKAGKFRHEECNLYPKYVPSRIYFSGENWSCHLIVEHKICPTCDEVFCTLSQLNKHYECAHPVALRGKDDTWNNEEV